MQLITGFLKPRLSHRKKAVADAEAAEAEKRRKKIEKKWQEEMTRRALAKQELTKEEIVKDLKKKVKVFKDGQYKKILENRKKGIDLRGFAFAEKQHTSWGEVPAPNDAGHTSGGSRPKYVHVVDLRTVKSLPAVKSGAIDHTKDIIIKLFRLVACRYKDRIERQSAAK